MKRNERVFVHRCRWEDSPPSVCCSALVNDLEFREYANYLRRGLSQSGFIESPSLDQADLAIFVGYGIGDTKEHAYSYSLPVYGQTGGGTYNFSATTYSGYGSATTYGTASQMPQYGVVGSQQISGTAITHLRYLFVDARDMRAFRNEKKAVSVWRTDVMSRGTSGDLRSVFPVLVAAAAPLWQEHEKASRDRHQRERQESAAIESRD